MYQLLISYRILLLEKLSHWLIVYFILQIRRMVGTIVSIAQGKEDVSVIKESLNNASFLPRPQMAPADGLYLLDVVYPSEMFVDTNY